MIPWPVLTPGEQTAAGLLAVLVVATPLCFVLLQMVARRLHGERRLGLPRCRCGTVLAAVRSFPATCPECGRQAAGPSAIRSATFRRSPLGVGMGVGSLVLGLLALWGIVALAGPSGNALRLDRAWELDVGTYRSSLALRPYETSVRLAERLDEIRLAALRNGVDRASLQRDPDQAETWRLAANFIQSLLADEVPPPDWSSELMNSLARTTIVGAQLGVLDDGTVRQALASFAPPCVEWESGWRGGQQVLSVAVNPGLAGFETRIEAISIRRGEGWAVLPFETLDASDVELDEATRRSLPARQRFARFEVDAQSDLRVLEARVAWIRSPTAELASDGSDWSDGGVSDVFLPIGSHGTSEPISVADLPPLHDRARSPARLPPFVSAITFAAPDFAPTSPRSRRMKIVNVRVALAPTSDVAMLGHWWIVVGERRWPLARFRRSWGEGPDTFEASIGPFDDHGAEAFSWRADLVYDPTPDPDRGLGHAAGPVAWRGYWAEPMTIRDLPIRRMRPDGIR